MGDVIRDYWSGVRGEQGNVVAGFWERNKSSRLAESEIRLGKMKEYFTKYFRKRGMKRSLMAMDIAMECHTGYRKCGQVSVIHQFEVVGIALQLFGGFFKIAELDAFIAACFLHDVVEDYSDKYDLIKLRERGFGEEELELVRLVSKDEGFAKTVGEYEVYYYHISQNVKATLLKAIDRLHNLRSMSAGFSNEKQIVYINETLLYILPILKGVRREASPKYYMKALILMQEITSVIETASYKLRSIYQG